MTKAKRVLLTKEILLDIGYELYEDMECLNLLETGSTLAGGIERCDIFKAQYKPCLMTLDQLQRDSLRRNENSVNLTVSSGSDELDEQLLDETREELNKGWAEGPFDICQLEPGSTISRRFPWVQGSKTRMIDDYSISGVNDSCATFNKIDLHVVDTFHLWFGSSSCVVLSVAKLAISWERPMTSRVHIVRCQSRVNA